MVEGLSGKNSKMFQEEPLDLSLQKVDCDKKKNEKKTFEIFSKLSLLMKHPKALQNLTKDKLAKIQSYKNILVCEICFKLFDRPSLLTRHMRSHSKVSKKKSFSKFIKKLFQLEKNQTFVTDATKLFRLPVR